MCKNCSDDAKCAYQYIGGSTCAAPAKWRSPFGRPLCDRHSGDVAPRDQRDSRPIEEART